MVIFFIYKYINVEIWIMNFVNTNNSNRRCKCIYKCNGICPNNIIECLKSLEDDKLDNIKLLIEREMNIRQRRRDNENSVYNAIYQLRGVISEVDINREKFLQLLRKIFAGSCSGKDKIIENSFILELNNLRNINLTLKELRRINEIEDLKTNIFDYYTNIIFNILSCSNN